MSATGELQPVDQVDVGTEISGIVDRVFVDYNAVIRLYEALGGGWSTPGAGAR